MVAVSKFRILPHQGAGKAYISTPEETLNPGPFTNFVRSGVIKETTETVHRGSFRGTAKVFIQFARNPCNQERNSSKLMQPAEIVSLTVSDRTSGFIKHVDRNPESRKNPEPLESIGREIILPIDSWSWSLLSILHEYPLLKRGGGGKKNIRRRTLLPQLILRRGHRKKKDGLCVTQMRKKMRLPAIKLSPDGSGMTRSLVLNLQLSRFKF